MARSALLGRRGDGGVCGQSPEADLHGGHHPALRASVELSASRYRLVPLTNGDFSNLFLGAQSYRFSVSKVHLQKYTDRI